VSDLWRLLEEKYDDPRKKIAMDEAVLLAIDQGLVPNTIRFWSTLNTVVIGRSQSVESEVNLEACRRHRTEIVRRSTGGGAVYQDQGNLNWSIILDRNDSVVKNMRNILETFKIFSKPVIEGLKVQGIDVEFISPSSIHVNGRKISGMAAYFKKKSILCHGTLLINSNLSMFSEVLKHLKVEVTTLQLELGKEISIEAITAVLMSSFNNMYNLEAKRKKMSRVEKIILEALFSSKYSQDAWNIKGSSKSVVSI